VRPEPKQHGRKNQIEGLLEKNKNIVVVEDLISTGKSSLNAVKALREVEGTNVKGMVAIFSYGFDIAAKNFEDANLKLNTLSDYDHLLEQSLDSKYITEKELETLQQWRGNPSTWEK
jgi:orotate phosphoribosyltransferase